MPFTSEISGIGAAQFTGSEYTNPALIQSFLSSLSAFYNLTKSGTAPTAADVQNIQNQLNYLTQMAKNGVSVNLDSANFSDPTASTQPNQTYYMTAGMVDITNRLFTSIAPNGNIGSITLADLTNFQTAGASATSAINQNIFVSAARNYATLPPLAVPAGATVVYSAISTDPAAAAAQIARIFVTGRVFAADSINESNTKSIQSFTELIYVQTANEVINDKLVDLKNALQATQSSLDNLNQLQQLHNQITVVSRTFTLPLGSTGVNQAPNNLSLDQYVSRYEKYTSAQLKAALVPQLNTETLPFSLPATEYTITKETVPAGVSPITTTTQWKFTLTLNNPSKYYAFNTSTNQFQPVATTYALSGYYVSASTGGGYPTINPANFTNAQIAQIVGDGYNGVQKFPLLGTISGMSTLKLQLTRQRGALSSLLVDLIAQTPASVLNDPLKRSQALLGQMSAVYGDLKTKLGPNPPANIQIVSGTPVAGAQSAIRAWIMDNYQTFSSPDASNAGLIQQKITAAITAAQSTNDTQKQDVRNSLLVFEEYYKSAATVLNQLTQIISRMAQGIAK